MKKVIVFDLDDTLYPEIEYVKSGFRAVAGYLHSHYSLPRNEVYEEMLKVLEAEGRGAVFNKVLEKHNLKTKHRITQCLSAYRLHIPEISLPDTTVNCLNRLKNIPKYIVTDGNKVVQYNKVKALGVESYMNQVFITHRYGVKHAKPSPYCFSLIQKKEVCQSENILYIGDNPKKDFVGIKPFGYKTVRILTGPYKDLDVKEEFEADYRISELSEITDAFINEIFR